MTEALVDHHLVNLLKNFNNPFYIDYMAKVSKIVASCRDDGDFQTAEIKLVKSRDLAGTIGLRGKFKIPVYILLSHPICKFRLQRNYRLREPFFISRLGLVPVFFSSLSQMTVMKLWGNRAGEFFNPSNAPLPETDLACWEFPVSDRPVEYSSLNFIEQNGSQPEDAGHYLTAIFEKYFRLGYWVFPRYGFAPSSHFFSAEKESAPSSRCQKVFFLWRK